MKTILRQDIPEDYTYYRSGSQAFFEYYKKYSSLLVARIGKGYEFLKARKLLGGAYWSVTVEKINHEVTQEELHKLGIHRGIVFWTPKSITEKPKGWYRLPSWFAMLETHSSRSAFSILDTPDYWTKWSPGARGRRRKVLELIDSGRLVMQESSFKQFLRYYYETDVRDPHKRFVGRMTEKLFIGKENKHRVYLALIDGKVLAGAVFIDEGVTSEYWASFYADASRPYHLGIAMMDQWFADSLKIGIKYCDLDHMRDTGEPRNRVGYTKFKESIADYDVYWRDTWIRFF